MRSAFIIVAGGGFLAGAALAQDLPAGDPAQGETLLVRCQNCHGRDGIARFLAAPNIGGEDEAYLARQLAAYRDGTRTHEMMTLVVKDLSDQDLADLAAYYAGLTLTASVDQPDAAPELCVSCHGADGIAVIEEAPDLAGDAEIYIEDQLKAYRDGTRQHDIMSSVAADLTDEEIKAAARWYSSVPVATN